MSTGDSALATVLHSGGPAAGHEEKMRLYAWLVGRWDLGVTIEKPDGTKQSRTGLVAAGWVLEGCAIQDVFAVPGLFHGTTLRVYDPMLGIWHVSWTDPLNQVFLSLTGRADGDEIVNEGPEPPSLARLYGEDAGSRPATVRWIFSEIEPDRFRWRSERSVDGRPFQLQRTYVGSRVG